jgi:GAF domain-containing protein
MADSRMSAALALLGGGPEGAAARQGRAAALAAAALGVDGICVGVGAGRWGAVGVWGRETVAVVVEGLEFTLGEGPSRDAVIAGAPVLVADLDAPEYAVRWPGFAFGVSGFPVRAVFAFPLLIGAIGVGVLTAHRAVPGPMTDRQLANALALADAVALLLVHRVDPEVAQTRRDRVGSDAAQVRQRDRVDPSVDPGAGHGREGGGGLRPGWG